MATTTYAKGSDPAAKIPVFKSIGSASSSAYQKRREIGYSALVPLTISTGLFAIGQSQFALTDVFRIGSQAYSIASAIPVAYFAHACHRICLQHEGAEAVKADSITLRPFVAWFIGMYVAYALSSIIPKYAELHYGDDESLIGLIVGFVGLALYIGFIVFVMRSCLVLPSTVIGDGGGIRGAWSLSRGKAWRILWMTWIPCILFLVPLIVFISGGQLPTLDHPGPFPITPARIAVAGVLQLVNYVVVAVEAFILCQLYLKLRPAASST